MVHEPVSAVGRTPSEQVCGVFLITPNTTEHGNTRHAHQHTPIIYRVAPSCQASSWVYSVSMRVSPVGLVGCIPTGHRTVAMASCPPATQGARGGPALSGWHSLPHRPGTFSQSVTRVCVFPTS